MTYQVDGLLAMKRAGRRKKLGAALMILLAIAVMLLFLGPLYISVTTSLKSRPELAKNVLGLPRQLNWANYQEAMERSKFLRSLLNSCIITFPSVALLVLMASMGGYAIARFGKERRTIGLMDKVYLAALMIPFQILMIPVYKLYKMLGLQNNLLGVLIMLTGNSMAYSTFLYVGFIKSVPRELEEAALVDGCGSFKVFWSIVFPLLKPITATVAALHIMWFHPFYTNYCWKDDFDFAVDKASGKSKFVDDQRVKDAWTEFMSTSKYWSDDPFGTSYDDACMAIANGEAAMISNGTWILAKLLSYNPDLELGVFGYPTKKFGGNLVMRPGSIMCVYNNTKDEAKLNAAKELFASLFTPEAGDQFASGALQLSSVKGVDYSFSPVLGEIIDYPNKWSIAGFSRWGNEYEDVWFDVAMAFALDGNDDPEAFCAELDAQFSTMQ